MINLSSFEQEQFLKQISKSFESQANLIKIYPSSKNFSKCFLDTASLISLLKYDVLTPSNYYLLYTDIIDLLEETIEYYIRDNVYKGTKIKYIYESIQQCQYLIPRIYLMIVCGSINLELYPIKYEEVLTDLLNAVKCVQNPLRGFWIRYFLFKNIKNNLPIKTGYYINNEEYFFLYREISLNFLMKNLEEMIIFANRTRKEIFIDNKKIDEKQRANMFSCIEEIIEEISNMKGINKYIFVNKILPKFFDIISYIDDEDDFALEQVIIMAIVKYFNIEFYYETQGISIIFLILRKIIDNKEIDNVSIFNNMLNNYIKLIKSIKKIEDLSLRKENLSIIKTTFSLFLEKYNELQITYKNSEDKEFNRFIDLDITFIKYSLKILKKEKNEQKISIINNVLKSCSRRLNMFNYGFTVDSIKKICSLIEVPLKYKYTIFDFPILETMINYLDYNHRKHISLKLIKSFENKSSEISQIDSLEKLSKILHLITPLISEEKENNEENDFKEYLDEDDKNMHLSKLIYIIYSNKPEIMIQMLSTIKNFINSGTNKTAQFINPIIISNIINYIRKLDIFQKDFIFKTKKVESVNEKENKKNKSDFNISIELQEDKEKYEKYFIKLMKDIFDILNECILMIENKDKMQAFQFYMMVCFQINKMKYITQINNNLFNDLFEEFFQKSISIIRNMKDLEIKYKMFEYMNGYLKNFIKFLSEEKIINLLDSFEKEFSNFNNSKFQFKMNINLCDSYMFILKDYSKVGKYLDIAYNIINKDKDSYENINLLIILINKVLLYIENENIPKFIEIINKAIKILKDNESLNNKSLNEESREKYKNILKYISKKKNQKNNSLYKSIIL